MATLKSTLFIFYSYLIDSNQYATNPQEACYISPPLLRRMPFVGCYIEGDIFSFVSGLDWVDL